MCPLFHCRGRPGNHSQQLWGDAIDDIIIIDNCMTYVNKLVQAPKSY